MFCSLPYLQSLCDPPEAHCLSPLSWHPCSGPTVPRLPGDPLFLPFALTPLLIALLRVHPVSPEFLGTLCSVASLSNLHTVPAFSSDHHVCLVPPGKPGFHDCSLMSPNSNAESRVWHITGHSVSVFGMNQVNGRNLVLILVVMTAANTHLAPTVCQAQAYHIISLNLRSSQAA